MLICSANALVDAGLQALRRLAHATTHRRQLVVVGVPIPLGNCLYNAAAAVSQGQILGIVPKQNLPCYREFYESRWFRPASGTEPKDVELSGTRVPFGIDLLFRCSAVDGVPVVVGIEICEDLWVPIPPSSVQAALAPRCS